jgi:regulatory protein
VEERSILRPRSRKAMAYELRQHGVQPEIIQDAIISVDDAQVAYQAAQRKARTMGNLDWLTFRQRLLRYLAGKGFNYGTSSDAVRRVWDELSLKERKNDEGADK